MTILAVVGLILNASIATVAASRLVFAVARDGVLPFSSWVGTVTDDGRPKNAVTVMYCFGAVLLCTILPSNVAFTSLVSAGGIREFIYQRSRDYTDVPTSNYRCLCHDCILPVGVYTQFVQEYSFRPGCLCAPLLLDRLSLERRGLCCRPPNASAKLVAELLSPGLRFAL